MRAAQHEVPAEARKAVIAPAEANRRKPSAPSFAEIIGSVELRPEDRAPRPPARKARKEERKAPVVVRKPPLGRADESAAPGVAAGAPQEQEGAERQQEHAAPVEQPPRMLPDSSYAEPGADEGGDFAALLAESEKTPRKQQKLRLGSRSELVRYALGHGLVDTS